MSWDKIACIVGATCVLTPAILALFADRLSHRPDGRDRHR